MSTVLKIQSRGTVTIPKKMREALGVADGDLMRVVVENGAAVFTPMRRDVEVYADIAQSLEDLKKGEFISFASVGEMRKKLRRA